MMIWTNLVPLRSKAKPKLLQKHTPHIHTYIFVHSCAKNMDLLGLQWGGRVGTVGTLRGLWNTSEGMAFLNKKNQINKNQVITSGLFPYRQDPPKGALKAFHLVKEDALGSPTKVQGVPRKKLGPRPKICPKKCLPEPKIFARKFSQHDTFLSWHDAWHVFRLGPGVAGHICPEMLAGQRATFFAWLSFFTSVPSGQRSGSRTPPLSNTNCQIWPCI